ncbi:DUF6114 domain-containing protein [Streptomyces sp. NBC_00291]|uniref:DUF6114 domain-containing protein n=1 Tax=Streptomyces sp. NBC_00291 TaxID=2975704 RepID=UPI00224CE294|nr:DUF6114 domain-containing protein [Streptomyces sp. NBC_00291]MCX5156584.1 DUF6114 domain-containing protein [Streptomyces sp. NBC_00291]
MPGPRRRPRAWRRTRPFGGGLLLVSGGIELLLVPLSPLTVLVGLGLGGVAAIGIGAALVVAGLFLWFLPQARAYVSIHALLLSVLSFVATNLGGFLVGMLLGIAGSAPAFGWTPLPEKAEQEEGEESADGEGATDRRTAQGAGAEDGGGLVVRLPAAHPGRRGGVRSGGPAPDPAGRRHLVPDPVHGCIEELLCVAFSPEGLPAPPVIPPFAFMTRVSAEQALVTSDVIVTDGLRLDAS